LETELILTIPVTGYFNPDKTATSQVTTKLEDKFKSMIAPLAQGLKYLMGDKSSVQQDKIRKALESSLTEPYGVGNLCDDFTYKKFLIGGIDLATTLGNLDVDANGHYLLAKKNGLISTYLDDGLSVFFHDKKDINGIYDHISSVYKASDGSVIVYNHGGSDKEKKPYYFKDEKSWHDSWGGDYAYYNPWRKK